MRLVTYRGNIEAAARLGAVIEDFVVDVETIGSHTGVSLPSSMLDFINLGPQALTVLKRIRDEHKDNLPVQRGAATGKRKVACPYSPPAEEHFRDRAE